VELTEDGILIRPPAKEHHSHAHASAASSSEQEPAESERGTLEVSSSLLKVWQSLRSRFTRSSRNHNGDKK
jgi:hypothetical protein